MTIQLSVTVWTIICFLLLMVILNKLLFKPILEVMDKRKERIKNAADKKTEFERLEAEYESELMLKKAAADEEQKKRVKEKIATIRAESKASVESADTERLAMVEEYRIKTEEQGQQILNELSAHSEEIACFFSDSLVKE